MKIKKQNKILNEKDEIDLCVELLFQNVGHRLGRDVGGICY